MPDQILDFDQLFAANCAGCHGATGELGPAPPLNDPLFVAIVPDDGTAARDSRRTSRHADAAVRACEWRLAHRRASESARRGHQVALEIERRRSNETPPALRTHQESKACNRRRAAANAGPKFSSAPAPAATDQTAPAASGTARSGGAINVPAFLALISDQALRRIIITGRPDLGMPNLRRAATAAQPTSNHSPPPRSTTWWRCSPTGGPPATSLTAAEQ